MSVREMLRLAREAARIELERLAERLTAQPVEVEAPAPELPPAAAVVAEPAPAVVVPPADGVEPCWQCQAAPPAEGLVMCQPCIDAYTPTRDAMPAKARRNPRARKVAP